ncbi:MAG: 2OG-Fe(II) oxygenase family protein [Pseudomonadota bacterium]
MTTSFPVVDLGAFERSDEIGKRKIGHEVDAICQQSGFLAIGNHGVPEHTINALWDLAIQFFSLPADIKQKAKAPFEGYPYGYLGPETEALAKSRGVDTPSDLKESFNGGPLTVPSGMDDPEALGFCYAKTIWPEEPAGFVQAWKAYYRSMEDLAGRIMRLFAVALELPENHFDPYIDAPISALRALNYPEQTNAPKAGQLRAGAHTDYGSLTILLPQTGSKGLEIVSPDGNWTPVPALADTFVINIGDLMARWTNDRWVSTLHRVVNPPPDEGGLQRRQSFAFFHQPNWHTSIEALQSCLSAGEVSKYDPVLSGPYLMSKFKATTAPTVS